MVTTSDRSMAAERRGGGVQLHSAARQQEGQVEEGRGGSFQPYTAPTWPQQVLTVAGFSVPLASFGLRGTTTWLGNLLAILEDPVNQRGFPVAMPQLTCKEQQRDLENPASPSMADPKETAVSPGCGILHNWRAAGIPTLFHN